MQSKLDPSQIETYLKTLNVSPNATPDVETLSSLVYAHQTTIPFSSAGTYHCEAAPNLEPGVVFDKVIAEKRGGYCFEMNLIFKELLLGLGYDSYPVLCRVCIPGNTIRLPLTHEGIITTVDGMRYYTDVGFGGPVAAGALALDDGVEQTIQGETYRMRTIDECWWALERLSSQVIEGLTEGAEDPWVTVIELCTARAEDQDFSPLSAFCAQPGARFHESIVLNLRTPSGNYAFDGEALTIRENGEKHVIQLADEAARNAAIEEYFGIKL